MSEIQTKFNDMMGRIKFAEAKGRFDNPRTPVGRTGRLDHAFVEDVIKRTIVYETDQDGNYVPDGIGGYRIDYVASNEARERKYDAYDKALSAPSEYDQEMARRAKVFSSRAIQS
jgi:hypothetical protein